MITLDASVVIAHLYQSDPHHQTATDYLSALAAEGFIIHSLSLAEVLVGGVRTGRAQQILAELEAAGVQIADRPGGEALRLARLRASTNLKLPDCCALDTAMATATTLATFDEALAAAARQHGVSVAPAGWHG